MGEPASADQLTIEERHLIALLRQGSQSIAGAAEILRTSREQIQEIFQSLNRKVGIVPLFRYGTVRFGLAE
jgi:hypothetical protein